MPAPHRDSPTDPPDSGPPSRRGRPAWMRPLVLSALGIILLPPMLGANGRGCNKGCRPVLDETDTDTDAEWQKVKLERKLQVSRLMPELAEPQTGFTADVIGAGLEPNAKVSFGAYQGTNVTVHTTARLSVDVPPMPVGSYDLTVTNADGESVTLRGALTIRKSEPRLDCSKHVVTFGLDQDTLDGAARASLDPLIPCYQDVRGRIRLEGHADERGTVDYNLALGQRRADAVHSYLSGSGVPVSRLRTVSYGEERPVDRGHTDAAWARNRRVEILVEE